MLMHFLEGESVRFFAPCMLMFYFILLYGLCGMLVVAFLLQPLFSVMSLAVVLYRQFMSFIAYADW
jgi:hypothetical protein